jgi:hypothetical protein
MIGRSKLLLSLAVVVISCGPYAVTSSLAQGSAGNKKPYTPVPSYTLVAAACSASGNPGCNIECPVRKAATCENGQGGPGKCYCK